MADGFIGRWSQRKQDVREGKPLADPAVPAPSLDKLGTGQASSTSGRAGQPGSLGQSGDGQQLIHNKGTQVPATRPSAREGSAEGEANTPPPTLDDAQALTPESDFKPFMARNVDPEVKNAAMNKLFSDPHFNVMDGLDIYIDDYSLPDPLPESMLRKMAIAKTLNLFDDEKTNAEQLPVRDNEQLTATSAAGPSSPSPDPSGRPGDPREPAPTAASQLTNQDHAHTDLRLQQDHAPGPQGPGRGAG